LPRESMRDPGTRTDDRAAAFSEHRRLLFSIAYRMLGSASDAEDIVQETYLRWSQADTARVQSAKSYLTTTATRLALDYLRSARVRREVYVGPWLPEPLIGVRINDPVAAMEVADSLSTAFLVLLERLTPSQRAAFLLREVFNFEYSEIANVVGTSEANARQLVQRAKQHVAARRPRFASDARHADELTRRFLEACKAGQLDGLVSLLSSEAAAWADGGGKFAAARRPIVGADRVARFAASVVRKWTASGDVRIEPVNGGLGLVFVAGDRLRAVMTIDVEPASDLVDKIFIVVNPDKLAGLMP
jgi:RNA polymerase sigma-70 factor, ECF subfamily